MRFIEFHDSYLLSVDQKRGTLDLSAYVHLEETNSENSEGGYQRVRLTIQGLTVEGLVGDLPFDIYRETLFIDGEEFRHLLPLPSRMQGTVELKLLCREDAREVTFRGADLNAEVWANISS